MVKICKGCGKPAELLSWEIFCPTCLKEKELERIQQCIASGEEDPDTFSTDYVICPHCGAAYEQLSYDETSEMYNEGIHDMECDECGKHFQLCTTVSYSYETTKSSN